MDGENSFQFAKKDLFDEAIHSNLSDRNTDYSILNNDAHSNHNNSQHRGDNTQSANPNSESFSHGRGRPLAPLEVFRVELLVIEALGHLFLIQHFASFSASLVCNYRAQIAIQAQ